jgi:activator of HSP90 ATPase
MDPYKHAELVGSSAEIDNREGGKFDIYDGYITGTNVRLVPGKEIVQKWRAEEDNWPIDHYSDLTITLKAENEGTRLTMIQKGVPAVHAEDIGSGWYEYYWNPLHEIIEES